MNVAVSLLIIPKRYNQQPCLVKTGTRCITMSAPLRRKDLSEKLHGVKIDKVCSLQYELVAKPTYHAAVVVENAESMSSIHKTKM
mmetsp:Transcript_16139/g.18288  ORF Transcript_16139/g.18288 Transcript_16139/m.18288 type:complete len:85 (-) Transcript_16139:242-496(-)